MSRSLRVNLPDGWYHVTARGHNRCTIYIDLADRLHFLELLERMIEMHRVEIHGYVLMDNHYHLIVRTPEANLSQAIQWLNVSYSVWWNLKHQRCGSLFQGRFKSIIVEAGMRLLSLSQYIHYNPVAVKGLEMSKRDKTSNTRGWGTPSREMAAKRLEVLREYRWSSYRAYAGYERAPLWLLTAEVLRRVEGSREVYRATTEERLLAGHDEDFWSVVKWGVVLGSTAFAEGLRKQVKVLREHSGRSMIRRRLAWNDFVECMEVLKGEPWSEFCDRRGDWGRDISLWAARRIGGYTLAELAREIGDIDYSAVYQSVRRLENRARLDKSLAKRMAEYREKLSQRYNV